MEQPKAQPKKKNSPMYEKLMKVVKEETQEKIIVKETKEETTVSINWTQDVFDKKVNGYSDIAKGIHGYITYDKDYFFQAMREDHIPMIYDCYDINIAEQAREEINKIDKFRLASERTTNDPNYKYANDKEYPIVVKRLIDSKGHATYHGFTRTKGNRTMAFTYDDNLNSKMLKTSVESLKANKPAWRKLDSKPLADKIKAVCADIWPEDFTNESEDTNEIIVDCTNDATAGCDDLDI